MKSSQQEPLKNILHQIGDQLEGENVSEEKISTVGKALFEMSRVFQEIKKESENIH
jgi:hypothetical protein